MIVVFGTPVVLLSVRLCLQKAQKLVISFLQVHICSPHAISNTQHRSLLPAPDLPTSTFRLHCLLLFELSLSVYYSYVQFTFWRMSQLNVDHWTSLSLFPPPILDLLVCHCPKLLHRHQSTTNLHLGCCLKMTE